MMIFNEIERHTVESFMSTHFFQLFKSTNLSRIYPIQFKKKIFFVNSLLNFLGIERRYENKCEPFVASAYAPEHFHVIGFIRARRSTFFRSSLHTKLVIAVTLNKS